MIIHLQKIFLTLFVIFSFSNLFATESDPEVVSDVDLNRYTGQWYEIARYPNSFQKKCIKSSAHYSLLPNDRLSVYNLCFKKNGKLSDISGVAKIPDPSTPAKLKVRFNFFARGDYWIVLLDSHYQWSVVSGPKKKSLFILARTAPMEPELLNNILTQLDEMGFDLNNIIYDQY